MNREFNPSNKEITIDEPSVVLFSDELKDFYIEDSEGEIFIPSTVSHRGNTLVYGTDVLWKEVTFPATVKPGGAESVFLFVV